MIFEVQECLESGLKTAAWAFLRLREGTPNIDKRIRLQLYNPPSRNNVTCYNLIKTNQFSKMSSSLHVTISRISALEDRENQTTTNRSMRPNQAEKGRADLTLTEKFHAMNSR